MYLSLADTFTNPIALFTIALGIGILIRMIGHAASLAVVPALNIFGFPASFAVGTGMAHLFGRAIIDTFRGEATSNADFRRGILLGLQTAAGVSIGKVILLTLADLNLTGAPIRLIYVVVLAGLGTALVLGRTPQVTPRLARLGSMPFLGLFAGILMGFSAVSGAVILIPAMMLLGYTRQESSATGMMAMLIAAGWGTFTFAFGGRIEPLAVVLLIAGTTLGEQIGYFLERRVPYFPKAVLGGLGLLVAASSIGLKQLGFTTPGGYLLWGCSLVAIIFVLVRAIIGTRVKAHAPAPVFRKTLA